MSRRRWGIRRKAEAIDEIGQAPRVNRNAWVAGALGRPDPRILRRLARAAPSRRVGAAGDLATVTEGPDHVLLADRSLTTHSLGAGVTEYTWGHEGVWTAGSGRTELPSLRISPAGPRLSNGRLGVHPLFYRIIGQAAYFAPRANDLMGLVPEPVDVDWSAWSQIWVLGHTVGFATPVRQIRALPGGYLLGPPERQGRVARPSLFRTPTASLFPRPVSDSAAAEAALAQALYRVARRYRDRVVLQPLGMGSTAQFAHDLVVFGGGRIAPTPGPQLREDNSAAAQLSVALRLDFRTTEPPLITPIAGYLRQRRERILLDLSFGLGSGLSLDPGSLAADETGFVTRVLLPRLSLDAPSLVSARADTWCREAAGDAYRAHARRFSDDPRMAVLAAETDRISGSADGACFALIGPQGRVEAPFLARSIVDAVLSAPVGMVTGPRLQEQLRSRLGLPDLPADGMSPAPAHESPMDDSVLQTLAIGLDACMRIPGLLSNQATATLYGRHRDDYLQSLAERPSGRRWIRGMAHLGGWLNHYDDRFTVTSPPWSDGRR